MRTTLGNQRFRGTAVLGIALITLSLLLGACPQSSGGGDDDGTPPPVQYTLTFNTHGGSAVQSVTADPGTTVNKPADPARGGYTFLGWFSAETGGTAYTWPHTLNADVTMHAQWWDNSIPPPAQYTLTFNSHSGSAVAVITANAGTAVNKPADPARGAIPSWAGSTRKQGAPRTLGLTP
jgi:uncharacterized repeat protein (TIGR02543 family)